MKDSKTFLESLNKEEAEDLFNVWDSEGNVPFNMNMMDFFELSKKIKISVDIINKSQNPRMIILETWLLIDYTIRHLITHGTELNRYFDEEFSPLPSSTSQCIKILKRFLEDQRSKQKYPAERAISMSADFFNMVYTDRDFFEKLCKFEIDYNKKYFPDGSPYGIPVDEQDNNYAQVKEGWLKLTNKIDKTWFSSVEKLNEVRNAAAHSFNVESIYRKLGITGDEKNEKLKSFCVDLLCNTIGINKNLSK